MLLQAVEDFVDAAHAAQVGGETREAVIDDVRVRVVETGQHRRAFEVDDPGARAAQPHDLAATAGDNLAAGDGEVAERTEACPSERADPAARQDQIRYHRPLD